MIDIIDKILILINQDSTIITSRIADLLSKSRRTITRHIKELPQNGIIRRIGPDFGSHWEIVKKRRERYNYLEHKAKPSLL
ncbi:HTH domain-containing protein [Bacteroides congonensis]